MVGGRPVCDDQWGLEDATVVCRSLGNPRANTFTKESHYGNVTTDFIMDNVKELGFIYHFKIELRLNLNLIVNIIYIQLQGVPKNRRNKNFLRIFFYLGPSFLIPPFLGHPVYDVDS